MVACDMCGADTLLLANVALGAEGPTYTYRCPDGHITKTDFRSPPQDEGRQPPGAADAPATSPSSPLSPDGGVAGSPPES